MLMGTPVLSSAISTVATALPLWLTATIALRQFAVIISISLSVSFFFALLMLVPLLGMFGPKGRPPPAAGDTSEKRSAATLCLQGCRVFFSSRLHRAAVACAFCLLLMVRCPSSHMVHIYIYTPAFTPPSRHLPATFPPPPSPDTLGPVSQTSSLHPAALERTGLQ